MLRGLKRAVGEFVGVAIGSWEFAGILDLQDGIRAIISTHWPLFAAVAIGYSAFRAVLYDIEERPSQRKFTGARVSGKTKGPRKRK